MGSITFAQFCIQLLILLKLITGIAVMTMGILIAVNRIKSTRVLGIGLIISSIDLIYSFYLKCIAYTVSVSAYSKAAQMERYIRIIIILAAPFCVCHFVHKRYGKKLIYIPVQIILLVAPILSSIIVNVMYKSDCFDGNHELLLSAHSNLFSFIFSAIATIILIVAFYRNRDKEEIIPGMWVVRTITLGLSLIDTVGMFFFFWALSENNNCLLGLLSCTSELAMDAAALLMPIYILVRLSKIKKEASIHEEA